MIVVFFLIGALALLATVLLFGFVGCKPFGSVPSPEPPPSSGSPPAPGSSTRPVLPLRLVLPPRRTMAKWS